MDFFTDEELQEIVRITNEIYKMAYITYKPLADDLCSRVASYEEVEHFLDWILDFCGNDTILLLFKKVCRYYVEKYPGIIEYEISAYREMYE